MDNKIISLNESSLKNNKAIKYFLLLFILQVVVFQLLSVLRASRIYNTTALIAYVNIFISLIVIVAFLVKIKEIKILRIELILIIIPLIYIIYGIIANGFNRDLFADSFNSIFFIILFIYARNSKFFIKNELYIRIANFMFYGLILSIISYRVFPLIGINVYSVGATSIYFSLPLFVFFINKMKTKTLLTIILLIMGSKRGVLLGILIAVLVVIIFFSSNIKKTYRFLLLLFITMILIGTFQVSLNPERINKMPSDIQPLLTKIMFVNPFSDYNRIEEDYRISEAKSAFRPIIDEPLLIIMGKGPGYVYDVYSPDGFTLNEGIHNSHFSPVSIYVKYGLFYTTILYYYIFITVWKAISKLKKNKLETSYIIALLYVIAAVANSFTAFTIYSDYLFILLLGLLSREIYHKQFGKDSYVKYFKIQ